ncbi:MAG: hypothetical protein INR64_13500, partial [Caulobacteraceae bacterium]|nr:hypothetical protein [Caulobacter sp.]
MPKLAKLLLAAMAAAGAAASTAACAAPATGGHAWRTYVNVRYRYAICYPSDLLKAEPESPDSDGRTFDGGSGAEL